MIKMALFPLLSRKKIALDSSCFIYFFEDVAPYADLLEEVFEALEKGKVQGFCSSLILAELLPAPIKKSNLELVSLYKELERSPWRIRLVPLSTEIAATAGELRATYGLRTPDSIHLATAQSIGADIFLTNDARLKKVSPPRVEVLADFVRAQRIAT